MQKEQENDNARYKSRKMTKRQKQDSTTCNMKTGKVKSCNMICNIEKIKDARHV